MLALHNITKDYLTGENTVHALKGLDLEFRGSEFVSILGPSGCGKTTLLNIIGGLDHYTSGDLLSGGRSTTPTGTTPSALSSRAITSSATKACCKMSSWR